MTSFCSPIWPHQMTSSSSSSCMHLTPAEARPWVGTVSSAKRMHRPLRLNMSRSSMVAAGSTVSSASSFLMLTAANFLLRTS